mmetsp:Transcript_32200/g.62982  ORF Transcript_32200/g.62982 Transcript_32200/m.62982 type:complete len:589 (+) Transcript_32200:70-1836(+)
MNKIVVLPWERERERERKQQTTTKASTTIHQGYAQAKFSCPHAKQSINLSLLAKSNVHPMKNTCSVSECGNTEENFVCTTCAAVFCGRWRHAHMVQHNKETGHNISLGFADLSFWCYGCDSYLHHLTIRPVYDAYGIFHQRKFDEAVRQPFGGENSEGEALKEAVQMFQQQEQASEFDKFDPSNSEATPNGNSNVEQKSSVEQKTNAFLLQASHSATHGALGSKEWSPPVMSVRCEEEARPGYQSMKAHEYQETPAVLKAKVRLLAKLLLQAQQTLAYTGAGISTASGIADYASKAQDSLGAGQSRPKLRTPWEAQPTLSHRVLTALAEKGLVHQWIQQNHDGLPQKAGCPQAILNEIHGAWYDPSNPVVPMSGNLRGDLFERLLRWEQCADLVLCIGTSVCGMNADRVVSSCAARRRKGKGLGSVIISLQQTQLDESSSLRIFAKIDDVMALLQEEMNLQLRPPKLYKLEVPQKNRTKVPDVFKLPYDDKGHLLPASDRDKEHKFLSLDLSEDSYVVLVSGPHQGDFGEVTGKNSEGHFKIRFHHSIKSGSQFKAPFVRILGLWWLDAAIKGDIPYLPIINSQPATA